MPRGRKSYTPEERLAYLTKEIENTKTLLTDLKEKKKELEEQIKQESLSQLYDLIVRSGKSLEEIKAFLLPNGGQDSQETASGDAGIAS